MSDRKTKENFVQLLEANKGIIYKICHSYCQDTGNREDLAQEITYQLWKSFPRYDTGHKFSTWMYRVALNVAISFYRRTGQTPRVISIHHGTHLIDLAADPEPENESKLGLLFAFIRELREIDRSIILLYFEEKSYKEIAEITGITETNVATRLSRIKDRLKTNIMSSKKNSNGTN